MIQTNPIRRDRVRKIMGSFAFIEHRFLRDGFFTTLGHHELMLYFFLILAADRNGLSYYSYDKICSLLRISLDEYILAKDALIEKDLIAFDGYLFQVLSLPEKPCVDQPRNLTSRQDMERYDPATIGQLIGQSFKTISGKASRHYNPQEV
jgi:hypothetical protein